jgi:glycosyltransferase involved in cell wall biosynthesis
LNSEPQTIKVAFLSGTDELNAKLLDRMRRLYPELRLYVVSEFAPEDPESVWIRYYGGRWWENYARCRAAFRDKRIRIAGVMLVPNVPFRFMRLMALLLMPLRFLAVNEHLNEFLLFRPSSLPKISRYLAWRASNFWRNFRKTGRVFPETLRAEPPAEPLVARFTGRLPAGEKRRILIASPYLPFPLSHGGAVRIYNLMCRAATSFDQILVVFSETETIDEPPRELLEICIEIVIVQRLPTHNPRAGGRPETVAEFASGAYERALREAVSRWRPAIAQMEFTQMAQYAAACAPAKTILVEHDITFDLYEQMLRRESTWDLEQQARRWRNFEQGVWRRVASIVVMSEQDRAAVNLAKATTLPNGVDLNRFRPSAVRPEPRRILFIGSFAHLPNLTAIDFFLRDVWPAIGDARLHIIAGQRHEYFLEYFRAQVRPPLDSAGVELEGFVSDVRGAYERAAVVVMPLVASAGTNIKVLEAMAMAKPIVSTPAGVNGIDLVPGEEFLLTNSAAEMAAAIETLFVNQELCVRLGHAARFRAERDFGWDAIARRQESLYNELLRR